jgi:hypothetical protein
MVDQFTFQGIHLHVVEFFHPLLQTSHVFLVGSKSPTRQSQRYVDGALSPHP